MREIVMSYAAALREALREEMRRDPNIVILGEDVGAWGGVFTVTPRASPGVRSPEGYRYTYI